MSTAGPPNKMSWMPLLWGSLFLLAFTFFAFQPALHAGFIWDDDDMLFQNPLVTNPGGFREIWFSTKFYDYFPLTLSSLWIEWRLWGNHAANYHFTNILLHAFSAVFFWRSFKYLKIPGAWIIALLFAVHPVNVESVAWITERKNTLSLFFYALSLLLFLRSETTQNSKLKIQNYWFSLAAFLLALFSKTSVVMLPVVLLGCVWWKHGKIRRADWLRTLPFFTLSLVLGVITIWFQYNRAISTDVVQDNNFWARLAGAGWAIWFYLGKIFAPLNLSFVYPRWNIDPHSLVSFLPTLAAVACLVLFWFYRKTWGRPFLFAFGYFVVTLFPVLGFFDIYFQKYSFVADHWQYQSLIGPLALFVAGLAFVLEKLPNARAKSPSSISTTQLQFTFAGAAIALCFGVLTFNQTKVYANSETLWRDTVQKNPDAWIAHNLLGAELAAQNKLDEAMEQYSIAIRLNPNHAEAHHNLGTALAIRGDFAGALEHLRAACKLNPNLLIAANTLAWILSTHPDPKLRNGAEAVRLSRHAVELTDEKNINALETLAAAYAESGNFREAIQTAKKGIELAKTSKEISLAERLAAQLESYQFYRPLRDESLSGN
jgi:tetratricopeptide (TPR) repeat protein